jgi:hypothetical protein
VTMILSLITAGYALQISDRRLSLKMRDQYDPWDPAANKSIVLLCRDGLISMGYTGPASRTRRRTGGSRRRSPSRTSAPTESGRILGFTLAAVCRIESSTLT